MLNYIKNNKKIVIPVIITSLALLLFNMVILIAYVPTSSMEPTIKAKSYIVCNRLASDFEKGDVIVFLKDNELLVKRIAGCSGDKVEINGVETVVPENSFFVLGDNSENSIDSRYWDEPFINYKNVIAKPIKSY